MSFQLFSIFNDDLPRLDIRDYRPALEGVYRMAIGGRPLTAGLRYDYDLTEQNDAWLAWRNIVQPYVSYAWASWTDTTIVYRYEDNDSKVDPTLNLKEELVTLRAENIQLREQLAVRSAVEFDQGAYFAKTETGRDGPFCSRCHEVD